MVCWSWGGIFHSDIIGCGELGNDTKSFHDCRSANWGCKEPWLLCRRFPYKIVDWAYGCEQLRRYGARILEEHTPSSAKDMRVGQVRKIDECLWVLRWT